MSVVGFVSHYVHFLDPFQQSRLSGPATTSAGRDGGAEPTEEATSAIRIRPPTPGTPELSGAATPILLLGGYSYGAMVTSQLPPVAAITALFDTPEYGTPPRSDCAQSTWPRCKTRFWLAQEKPPPTTSGQRRLGNTLACASEETRKAERATSYGAPCRPNSKKQSDMALPN